MGSGGADDAEGIAAMSLQREAYRPQMTKECRWRDHEGERTLPLSKFGKNALYADGVHIYCKRCCRNTVTQNRDYRESMGLPRGWSTTDSRIMAEEEVRRRRREEAIRPIQVSCLSDPEESEIARDEEDGFSSLISSLGRQGNKPFSWSCSKGAHTSQ